MQVALDNNTRRKLIIVDDENKKAYALEFPSNSNLEDLLGVSKAIQETIEKSLEEEKEKAEEAKVEPVEKV